MKIEYEFKRLKLTLGEEEEDCHQKNNPSAATAASAAAAAAMPCHGGGFECAVRLMIAVGAQDERTNKRTNQRKEVVKKKKR